MTLDLPPLRPGEITVEDYAMYEAFQAYMRSRRVEENHHNRRVSPEMRAILRQRIARFERRWPEFLAAYEERNRRQHD